MYRISLMLSVFVGLILVVMSSPAAAQDGLALLAQDSGANYGYKAIGAGLAVIGAGMGIGWIGASACSGIARQPEMAGKIQTAMIIAAALIEGAAFAAILFGIFTNG